MWWGGGGIKGHARAHVVAHPPPSLLPSSAWLATGALQRMVLVIAGSPEGDVLERWTFDVHTDAAVKGGGGNPDKDEAEIVAEIQAIIRQVCVGEGRAREGAGVKGGLMKFTPPSLASLSHQITASVTFLPLLTRPCTFDLLIYADRDADVPLEWEDSDARMIEDAATVRLRSFTTRVHRVDALVAYRAEAEDVC